MTERVFTPKAWLYCGVRISGDWIDRAEPYVLLREATLSGRADFEAEAISFAYKAATFKRLMPGRIYELETSDDGRSIRFGKITNSAELSNDEKREALVAENRAALAALDAAKRRKKLAAEDVNLAQILAPLREPYRRCRTREAAIAFELLVLDALRRG